MDHNYKAKNEFIELLPMDEHTSEEYRKLRNREDNAKFFFSSAHITAEQQKTWFEKYLKDETQAMFSVNDVSTNKFIGGIGFYDLDTTIGIAEVGRIIIDRNQVAGKGYGALAIKEVTKILIDNYGLNTIVAYIYKDNFASRKSFEKAGYHIDNDFEDDTMVKVLYEQ